MQRILLTGASGFVGSPLTFSLLEKNFSLVTAGRRRVDSFPAQVQQLLVGDLSAATDWSATLAGVYTVIHLAARVHVMADTAGDPLAEFRQINRDATLNLARQAASCGVQRFIYLSSVKVNGEETGRDKPFTTEDIPAPVDPYGVAKHEAEQGLREIACEKGMEVVIIRPPLVYGPGVKGNFQTMIYWLAKGIPLPFASIHNQRSLLALDNLIDFIITCIDHPAAANEIFLVADGEDLSTTEIFQRLAHAMGKSARLIPVPVCFLKLVATCLGKRKIARRLCGNLQVDSTNAAKLLGWLPPISVDEGLRRCVASPLLSSEDKL